MRIRLHDPGDQPPEGPLSTPPLISAVRRNTVPGWLSVSVILTASRIPPRPGLLVQ
ncbi:hypothetical protein I553_6605 [Mycobacterium xenopi 4042]|uniref:Uncharacterized protein n=1 Tax=Mycobacterium xenopi 4042 TaxID=1299334 RepID=X8BI58_MYCXE|nr:hypothetical protein I553_6605 [Mycobacterium xenopi 4042]